MHMHEMRPIAIDVEHGLCVWLCVDHTDVPCKTA